MNTEQTAIAEATEPKIIVAAGPGSGKTHTLTQRIAALIRKGANPSGIVCLTFTNAGAVEMRHRLAGLGIKRLGHLGTLHAYCLRMIQAHAIRFGYPNRIEMIAEAEARRIMEDIARQNCGKLNEGELRAELPAIAAGAKPRTRPGIMAAAYLRRLRTEGLIDFETALLEMRRCAAMMTPIQHLIVDEAQDSGPIDWDIFDALPAANRFFVGDPDQSIFGFRGADVSLFEKRARDPEWRLYKMETNYRSVPAICAAANRLIEHNEGRIPKSIFPASLDCLEAVSLPSFATDNAERLAIIDWIRALQANGVRASEIAILYRRNDPAIELRKIGRKLGLPVPPEPVRRPADWDRARAALECLRNPGSLSAYFRFMQYVNPEGLAAEKSAAALDQRTVTPNIPKNATAGNVVALLGQLGVSHESTEQIQAIVDSLPEPELIEIAAEMAKPPETQTGDFLHVGTIHSSKGREWNHVWLAAFEQGEIPGRNSVVEERRLAFVGITRARRDLVLSHSSQRSAYGKAAEAKPSQFLNEIQP